MSTRPSLAGEHVFLYAFDLLEELDGQDLRREPLETRKATHESRTSNSPVRRGG